MKIRHNLNGWSPDRTDAAWAEQVEEDARRTTDAAERRYRALTERIQRAEDRLRASEERLHRARHRNAQKRAIRRLSQDAESRRQELLALHREMAASPYGSQHRGTKSYRPVPSQSTPL